MEKRVLVCLALLSHMSGQFYQAAGSRANTDPVSVAVNFRKRQELLSNIPSRPVFHGSTLYTPRSLASIGRASVTTDMLVFGFLQHALARSGRKSVDLRAWTAEQALQE